VDPNLRNPGQDQMLCHSSSELAPKWTHVQPVPEGRQDRRIPARLRRVNSSCPEPRPVLRATARGWQQLPSLGQPKGVCLLMERLPGGPFARHDQASAISVSYAPPRARRPGERGMRQALSATSPAMPSGAATVHQITSAMTRTSTNPENWALAFWSEY